MTDLSNASGAHAPVTRRSLIGALLGAGAVLLAPARALARACRLAVVADEGPFYPVDSFPETEDLVGSGEVPGQLLYFIGRITDTACRPLPGAVVEIWQCDAGGQYKHPRAPQVKRLESGFTYFAKTRVGDDGAFRFRTLRPAPYAVFGLRRAPHIHVRVKHSGRELTTEIYFDGREDEALRTGDQVFQSRGGRKGEMIAALRPATELAAKLRKAPEARALACEYDLMIG